VLEEVPVLLTLTHERPKGLFCRQKFFIFNLFKWQILSYLFISRIHNKGNFSRQKNSTLPLFSGNRDIKGPSEDLGIDRLTNDNSHMLHSTNIGNSRLNTVTFVHLRQIGLAYLEDVT